MAEFSLNFDDGSLELRMQDLHILILCFIWNFSAVENQSASFTSGK